MNDLTMTVAGWVATDPKQHVGPTGVRMTTFRLASTSRYFDREKNAWVDGRTEWFSVRVFRSAAITVGESISKGQPVTVHGRFRTNEWESETGPRTDLVLDATSLGHDLTRGTATFTRTVGDESLTEEGPGRSTTVDGASADAGDDEGGAPDADHEAVGDDATDGDVATSAAEHEAVPASA